MVVSASINWGKRCPHFLAETRPPFFATSLRANGKNGHARRRGKKNTFFFAAAPLVVRSPKKKPHRLSAFACEESDDEKRKARDGQRRRASRRTRAIFFTRIRAFARKIARFAKKPPFAAAVAGASSSAERVVFRRGASLELFAPCVRPRARSRERRLRRRNTPAQKIVLEQVFFTNRSLEASWVNSVRSSPLRVVVSAPFKKKTRAPVGQKWKIDAFANVAFERHLRWIRGEGARGDERAASPRLRLPRARRRLRRAVGSKFMLSNRQKAGKGFGRTGAACVVVTPRERGGGGGSEARKANAAGIEKRGGGFAGRGGRCHASAARTARIASRDLG